MPEPLRISASDGYALGANIFGPESTGPIVVVNGATGVKQRYYARFALWLAERNCTVITYDYRGIGESRPHHLRGFTGSLRDWGQLDFEGVLRFASTLAPSRPVAVIGHSVGGQLLGFAPSNTQLGRAVTVGSQSGSWRHWPGARKLMMWAVWNGLMPAFTHLFGYLPGKLGTGEDLPKNVALEWARWGRHREFFKDDGISTEGFSRLTLPIESFSFTDDSYAPSSAVDWLHGLFSNARVQRHHLAPADLEAKAIGHFGAFNTRFNDTLWPRLAVALGA